MKIWPLLLAVALAANSATAAEYQFKSGEPITIRPESAYLLVRTFSASDGGLRGTVRYSPILIRELSNEELNKVRPVFDKNPFQLSSDAEPNVVQPNAKQPFAEAKGAAFLIVPLKPGTYILGGVSVTNWALKDGGLALTCLCMGTVKFEAKPGVVTDLGAILVSRDDQPTDVPEFAQVVSGRPRGFGPVPPQVAIRPATAEMEMPEGLAQIKVVAAAYSPVGNIPNYIGARVSRLVPMPGILSYDKHGQVTATDVSESHNGLAAK